MLKKEKPYKAQVHTDNKLVVIRYCNGYTCLFLTHKLSAKKLITDHHSKLISN